MKRLLILVLALMFAAAAFYLARPTRAEALVERAGEARRAGDDEEAFALFEEALRLAGKNAEVTVRALLGSADILYDARGDLPAGRQRLEQALTVAREAGEGGLEADVLSAFGRYYWWYERQRERPRGEFYEPALKLYREAGDRRGVAGVLARIALVDLAEGQFDACARRLEESRSLYEVIGDRGGLIYVYTYLGALAAATERLEQADAQYRKALELAEQEDDVRARNDTLGLLARLQVRRGDYEAALAIFDELIAAEPASVARRNHLVQRGGALMHLGRFAEARDSYESAVQIDDDTPGRDPPFRASTFVMLSHARRLEGNPEAARLALEEAAAVPVADKGWGVEVLELLARADLLEEQGRPQEALAALVAAAELESQTYGSARPHFFQTQYRQVFDRLYALLLRGVAVREEAERLVFRLLEQMRYRSFRSVLVQLAGAGGRRREVGAEEQAAVERIERLSTGGVLSAEHWGELRRAYADYEDAVVRSELKATSYRRLAAARPVELAEVQRRLTAETALVEYVLAGERVFALVVRRDRLKSVLLPAATAELQARVKLFRDLLFGDGEAYAPAARELGRQLVDPLFGDGVLRGVRRLVLVPMGFLHDLPFAALQMDDGSFLVQRMTLVLTPSATLWARPREPSSGTAVVAFGVRESNGSELAPLVFAEEEAAAVAAAFGGEAYLGVEATEAAFKERAVRARWLHVAAHGVAEPRLPLHARLELQAGDGEDGRLTVREILDLEVGAELVTLSACATGLAGGNALEVDRVGFVEAFLHAGAGNVLATLLPVSDRATAELMTRFYGRLGKLSPADALAASQRELLDGEEAHPRLWAPFVLVGGIR